MRLIYSFLLLAACSFPALAQNTADYWSVLTATQGLGPQQIVPQRYATLSLDVTAFQKILSEAPGEEAKTTSSPGRLIAIPYPDGSLRRFFVFETGVLSEDLKRAYPGIRTYGLAGVDDRSAHGTLDWTDYGLHAMIRGSGGDLFVDPFSNAGTAHYISYFSHDFVKEERYRVAGGNDCEQPAAPASVIPAKSATALLSCVGAQLRTYRLIVACTGEYAKAATGLTNPTISQTLSKIVTTVNRVSGIYESEAAVRLQLAATTTAVIFTDPAGDPFNGNSSPNTLIAESQSVISANIGAANYDIGHTFSTGAGGLATLSVVCSSSEKARGVTGLPYPVGDPYDIDYVAHEIAHQFNARHTFNAITGNCSGQREAPTAVEPGSGITIMGYAGICGTNNLANNSIAYFHAVSYDAIVGYINSPAGSCGAVGGTGNQPPLVSVQASHVIPRGTPFILQGTGSDPDNDPLSYSWEETDVAASAGNWNSGLKPYFRSYPPGPSPIRYFPSEAVVLSGNHTGTRGEFLSDQAQTLNFRLTARDQKTGGGGVCSATTTVQLDASGPFRVSYPSAVNIAWAINTQKKITWDVNGTDLPPVDCDSVSIWISDNGGNTYSIVTASTPNDGEFDYLVPNLPVTNPNCRIRIESRYNIFYDLSDYNFTISTDPMAGMEETGSGNSRLKVWPNPFSETLNIGFGGDAGETVSVSLISMLGAEVYATRFVSKAVQHQIEVPELPPGVYLLRAATRQGQELLKIVKEE